MYISLKKIVKILGIGTFAYNICMKSLYVHAFGNESVKLSNNTYTVLACITPMKYLKNEVVNWIILFKHNRFTTHNKVIRF